MLSDCPCSTNYNSLDQPDFSASRHFVITWLYFLVCGVLLIWLGILCCITALLHALFILLPLSRRYSASTAGSSWPPRGLPPVPSWVVTGEREGRQHIDISAPSSVWTANVWFTNHYSSQDLLHVHLKLHPWDIANYLYLTANLAINAEHCSPPSVHPPWLTCSEVGLSTCGKTGQPNVLKAPEASLVGRRKEEGSHEDWTPEEASLCYIYIDHYLLSTVYNAPLCSYSIKQTKQ